VSVDPHRAQLRPSPHRITTDRLVLRAYERSDVLDVYEAIEANAVRLQAFMAWAREAPETIDERREKLAHFRREFDEGNGTNYGVFNRSNGNFLGGFALTVTSDPAVLEIGYWLTAEAEGKWFAGEATSAMAIVALAYRGARRVEIQCDPLNARSRAVAQRVGFTWFEASDWVPDGRLSERAATETWIATADHLRLGPLATAPRPALSDANGNALTWPSTSAHS
jgi:RimJ/RimL family protein N-acetyltransferase